MANRLTKIVTRTGDAGETGLGDGSRVAKSDLRIQALGDVDELNSWVGLVLCEPLNETMLALLQVVQRDLFDLGGELSIPGHVILNELQLRRLDGWVEQWNAELPALREFILPGGCREAALLHVARSICRRAERSVAALRRDERSALAVPYLNRLSDFLFVLARRANQDRGRQELLWRDG